ncbi:MAG: MBOAT family O-acyltransferase [Geminicoccaceae bacterium]
MLFNSYEFILVFLPLTLFLFFTTGRRWGRDASVVVLVLASLSFYGWWNPVFLLLILASVGFNFTVGRMLSQQGVLGPGQRKAALLLGIGANLGAIAYFKYANFLVDSLNHTAGSNIELGSIILPLAISFFTFQQIAYLVDAYRGRTPVYGLIDYALFVTFFPQLIAGPIVHHAEMLPQFMRRDRLRPLAANMAVGITIFTIGLFKKAVLADGIATSATPVFDAADSGEILTFFEAWGGALAYSLQLYFDFSGYSDMAIGAARLFGIMLPLNFYSPYKAVNITEFWRRWHITLSRFLRDYLYIPLGGNRCGSGRRCANLMITMLLGGLWHGAGWTFVIWGGLHGLYLVVHQFWVSVRQHVNVVGWKPSPGGKVIAWAITYLAVVVGWVFFRAADFEAAVAVLQGMAGLNGIAIPNAIFARLDPLARDVLIQLGVDSYIGGGAQFVRTYIWIALLLCLSLTAPNTGQIMGRFEPASDSYDADPNQVIEPFGDRKKWLVWQPGFGAAIPVAAASVLAFLALSSVSEFLYFQF